MPDKSVPIYYVCDRPCQYVDSRRSEADAWDQDGKTTGMIAYDIRLVIALEVLFEAQGAGGCIRASFSGGKPSQGACYSSYLKIVCTTRTTVSSPTLLVVLQVRNYAR